MPRDELEQQLANEEAERQQQIFNEQQRMEEEERQRQQQNMLFAQSQELSNSDNSKAFNLDAASKKYSSVQKIYADQNFFARTFSHFLPNSWTHAGRLRENVEFAQRMLERGLNGNDLGSSKKNAHIKDPTQRVLADYKDNYSKLISEYHKINWFARRLSFFVSNRLAKSNGFIARLYRLIIPNSVLRAAELRTDIKMNDHFLREKLPTIPRLEILSMKSTERDKLKNPEDYKELDDINREIEKSNELVDEERINLRKNLEGKSKELYNLSKEVLGDEADVSVDESDVNKREDINIDNVINDEFNINNIENNDDLKEEEVDEYADYDENKQVDLDELVKDINAMRTQPKKLMEQLNKDTNIINNDPIYMDDEFSLSNSNSKIYTNNIENSK